MSSVSKIKETIANLKKIRHKWQQKGNRKMIEDTLAKEARLQKDLVKAEWQERQINVMQAQRELKAHQKELSKQKRDLTWGPTLNVLRSVGKAVGSGIKAGAKSTREHARRGRERIEAYDKGPRITGLDRVLDRAGASIRKMERHDTAIRHAEERKAKPDPYHRTGAVHAGSFDITNMDPRTVEKIRRARGV